MITEAKVKQWIAQEFRVRQVPTSEVIRAIGRSEAVKAVMNGSLQYVVQTTDATSTAAITISVDDYFGGKLRVEVIGVEDSGAGSLAGEQVLKFWKDTTLNLGIPSDILPLDSDIAGATYSVNNVSDSIEVTITGVAATVINWILRIDILQTNATTLP
jgi:hypothetical protein